MNHNNTMPTSYVFKPELIDDLGVSLFTEAMFRFRNFLFSQRFFGREICLFLIYISNNFWTIL